MSDLQATTSVIALVISCGALTVSYLAFRQARKAALLAPDVKR
jgi:hypothetical protein